MIPIELLGEVFTIILWAIAIISIGVLFALLLSFGKD